MWAQKKNTNESSSRSQKPFFILLSGSHPGQAPKRLFTPIDISFDVYSSEVVGIIGRNGPGKSTLLKIISGVTYPSSWEIEHNGRFID